MVLITRNDPLPIGSMIPSLRLIDTNDDAMTSDDLFSDGARGAVVAFTCNHCPYVRSYEGRMISLARETRPLGIQWLAINSNVANDKYPDDSFDAMKRRAAELGFPFRYAADFSQDAARGFGAACTPEFFLFDAARRLRFTGRLDDDQDETKARMRHLSDAINDLLAGRSVRVERSHPIGCSIKWI